MKKSAAFILAMAVANSAMAWGFLGHRTINNRAVYALPPALFGFYKKHIDYITLHSTDPDNRRYLLDDEGCRHFLDCDHYEASAPLDTIPHNWNLAVEMYGNDTLTEHGIVPWYCILMLQRLTRAFENHDLQKVLKYSADIGHYIADAHVPLHATSNYNGQKTEQKGIHALWESRIPQLFLDSFDLLTGTVTYLNNPQEFIWEAMSQSYARVDSVLNLEKTVSAQFSNSKFSYERIGQNTVRVYSKEFCEAYNYSMNKMVAKRMQDAVRAVASFWYTAWVDAGQPDLKHFTGDLTPDPVDEKAENASKNEKIRGREEHGKD